jgi:hypothetical protein
MSRTHDRLRFMGGRIEGEVPGPEDCWPLAGASTDECSQAGKELSERERLRQVVVGACIQPSHAIGDGRPRGQHQDGCPMTALAQAPAHLEAVDVGQHPVEDDGVVRVFGSGPEGVRAGSVDVNRVALLLKPALQETGHLHLVLDDKDPHGRPSPPLPSTKVSGCPMRRG